MIVQYHGILQSGKTVAIVADSISVNPTSLYFNADGTPKTADSVSITSSGAWTATDDDIYSLLQSYTNSGSGSGTATITVNYNDSYEDCNSCTITFTCGTASAYLNVYRDGISFSC